MGALRGDENVIAHRLGLLSSSISSFFFPLQFCFFFVHVSFYACRYWAMHGCLHERVFIERSKWGRLRIYTHWVLLRIKGNRPGHGWSMNFPYNILSISLFFLYPHPFVSYSSYSSASFFLLYSSLILHSLLFSLFCFFLPCIARSASLCLAAFYVYLSRVWVVAELSKRA